jgi:hypothetical protein
MKTPIRIVLVLSALVVALALFGQTPPSGGKQPSKTGAASRAKTGFFDSPAMDALLSHTELLVIGEIVGSPLEGKFTSLAMPGETELRSVSGILTWSFSVKVTEVLSGPASPQDKLAITIQRFGERHGDELPMLKAGSKCIFFLSEYGKDGRGKVWSTPDWFFGIEAYSEPKAKILKERAKSK